MSIDGSQVRDGLTTYVKGLGMTSSDVDRMHQNLQARLDHDQADRKPKHQLQLGPDAGARRRRRWVAGIAAVAVAAAVVGAIWVRRPQPPPRPAGPALSEEIIGVWRGNAGISMTFRADGTERFFTIPEGLLFTWGAFGPNERLLTDTGRYRVNEDTLAMSMLEGTPQACEYTFTAATQQEGEVDLTPVSQVGPGCSPGQALAQPFRIVRISPASPAGLALTAQPDANVTPVTSTNDLHGVWLLQGTGVVLVVNSSYGNAVDYRIDQKGTIDTAADNAGSITIPKIGQIQLKSLDPPTCADTTLTDAAAGDFSFTATVLTDPCNRFAGQKTLHWLRIQ